MAATYKLDSGITRHIEFPEKFEVPSRERRENLQPGDLVKLIFRIKAGHSVLIERMWVLVTEIKPEYYVGVLEDDPFCTDEIRSGMRVEFHSDHVIQIESVI